MNPEYQISVIIPVYNVEDYIGKCLDSVIQQKGICMEVICINDGSLDNSQRIIDKYTAIYSFIYCINQKNKGLSAARNTGIQHAKGEYIVLLDSDDWLEGNVLHTIYQKAITEDIDILVGNTKWIYSDHIQVEKVNASIIIPDIQIGETAIKKLMQAECYVPMAYNYICKRTFIIDNQLFFKEGLIYEDELWTPQIMLKANRVTAVDFYHYNYLQRSNTITSSSINSNKIDSCFFISHALISSFFFTNNSLLKDYFWIRACILFQKGTKMQEISGIKADSQFTIDSLSLFRAKLSFSGFNACISYLNYSKFQRRLLRIIYKILF